MNQSTGQYEAGTWNFCVILEVNGCSVWLCFKKWVTGLLLMTDLKEKMKGPIRTVAFGAAALDGVIFADDQRDP